MSKTSWLYADVSELDADGFQHVGDRRIKLYGGGGGGRTTATTYQTNVPEYAKPYVMDMLGRADALTTQSSYKPYKGQRVAEFTPFQNAAFNMYGNMQTPNEVGSAAQGSSTVGNMDVLAARNWMPSKFDSGFGYTGFNAPEFKLPEGADFDTSGFDQRDYDPGQFDSPTAQQYMSPYMQNVVDIQKREAATDADKMLDQIGAKAASQGAFGGSRHGLVEGELGRALGQQLNDIEAKGLQSSYEQAARQFEADKQREFQSDAMYNQYGLGGAQLGLSADDLASRYGLESQGMGAQYGLAGAQMANQYGLSGAQLRQQNQQLGAQYGLAALGQGLQSGELMGNMGQMRFTDQNTIAGNLAQAGAQQQALQQQKLDTAYQEYMNQMNYPYTQLQFMNSLVRGFQPNQTVYTPAPSALSQIGGLGLTAAGMYSLANRPGG